MENIGALTLTARELKNLEQAWEKKMLDIVKTKGLSARDIVDIVQEMTVVQGRLAHIHWDLGERVKKTGVV
jgi:hypothetical protein